MAMDTQELRLLSLDEVRKIVPLSVSYVYQLMSEGRFPRPVQIGRRAVRWRSDELQRWIQSQPHTDEVE